MAAGDVEVNVTTNNGKAGAFFDGVDDYVAISHNDNQLGKNLIEGLTISAWIFPNDDGEGGEGDIVDKSTGTDGNGGYKFQISNADNKEVRFKISAGTSVTSGDFITNYPYKWAHVLVTVSPAGKGNLYVNNVNLGVETTLGKTTADITTTNPITIGNRSGATDKSFDGLISQVKMWNRVLSIEERAENYAGKVIKAGLILDVPLQKDYNDKSNNGLIVTNSGSILTIQDDAIAAAIAADRTTANDKYLMVGMPGGQVVSAVIEEAA